MDQHGSYPLPVRLIHWRRDGGGSFQEETYEVMQAGAASFTFCCGADSLAEEPGLLLGGASHEMNDVGTSGSYDADSRSLLKVKVDCSEQLLSNIVFTPRAQVCTLMGQAEILGPKPAEPKKVPTSFIP